MAVTKQKGFSLLEVLLYISATLLVVAGLVSLYISTLSAQAKSKAIAEVETQSYYLMEKISEEISNAEIILEPTAAGQASRLNYLDNDNRNASIFLENDYIVQTIDGQSTLLNTSAVKIKSLNFINNSYPDTAQIIKITLTIDYNGHSQREEYNYSQSFTTSARQNIKSSN